MARGRISGDYNKSKNILKKISQLKSKHWKQELCGVHSGEIPNFDKLGAQLNDIKDYKNIFRKKFINFTRVSNIIGCAMLSAGVVGPMGYFYALANTTWYAHLFAKLTGSYYMSAATRIAYITATGVSLGASGGAQVSYAYLSDIKDFAIEKIKEGEGTPVIFINGFLTQKDKNLSDWESQLKILYPKNPWYHVRWESKRLLSLTVPAGKTVVTRHAVIKVSSFLIKNVRRVSGLSLLPFACFEAIQNPWHVAMSKAERTGILLADILARSRNEKFILIGHSLGARVIFYALRALGTKEQTYVDTVHLLGGAVGSGVGDKNKKGWKHCKKAVQNNIHNYLSAKDGTLSKLYRIANLNIFRSNPIGISEIKGVNGIINHDVTEYVSGHRKYKKNIEKFLIT